MAKFYTVVPRLINGEYVNGSRENPVEVKFPKGFNPLGRVVKAKGKTIRMEKKIVKHSFKVRAPKSGEMIETTQDVEVEFPIEEEVIVERFVIFTAAELAANGLIMRPDDAPAPEGEKLQPAHAGSPVGGAKPASSRDEAPGRPSDNEPK